MSGTLKAYGDAEGPAPIAWAEGYWVTRDGRVLSEVCRRGHSKPGKLIELKPVSKRGGHHYVVSIHAGGKVRTPKIARLVAEAFLPPRPSEGHVLRHLDGNPANNHAGNLAWGTQQENVNDRERHGRTARGERNKGGGKLNSEKVRQIIRRREEGFSQQQVADEFGVSKTMVRLIEHRKKWREVANA